MTVSAMRKSLTQDDIRRLVRGATPEERSNAAHKICRRIDTARLSPKDRENAEQIMAILAQDAAALVRRTVELCHKHDRPVATPADARRILGLPPRSA